MSLVTKELRAKYRKRITLCFFFADWHGGQWSRGYEMLCKIMVSLRRAGITRPLDLDRSEIDSVYYAQLEERYGGKV